MRFARFVAVDWSGAKRLGRSIAVAACGPGREAPRLVENVRGRPWTRTCVVEWLQGEAGSAGPILVGFDFAFAFPFCDKGAYFLGAAGMPRDARSLWRLVEDACGGEGASDDLYAGAFVRDHRFARCFQTKDQWRRRRLTECACSSKAKPESVFKLVGPKQVGKASLAGMRGLEWLKAEGGRRVRVWPFDEIEGAAVVCVEIFPRLFLSMACAGPSKVRGKEAVAGLLARLESSAEVKGCPNDHEADALISAAALRAWASKTALWNPCAMSPCARQAEGWIFGVS